MPGREERVAAVIREIVSETLREKIKDPRIGFVSVVAVEVTKDLSLAKVHVSILGSPQEKEATMEGLRSAQGLIRSEVARGLGLRRAPELTFVLDEGIEHSVRVSEILRKVSGDKPASEGDSTSP
ncbi:MAG TPA: 30S ribosome-binding factor RbfA [Firmicutes bacterium]|nr:30S ribosome-binding factor RbfA [Candidatus Fermentithermobacillaceae bacterium]